MWQLLEWVHLWIWLAKIFRTCAVQMYGLMAKSFVAGDVLVPRWWQIWRVLNLNVSANYRRLTQNTICVLGKSSYTIRTLVTVLQMYFSESNIGHMQYDAWWPWWSCLLFTQSHPSWSIYKIMNENQTDMNAVSQEVTLHAKQLIDKKNITCQNMIFRIKLP